MGQNEIHPFICVGNAGRCQMASLEHILQKDMNLQVQEQSPLPNEFNSKALAWKLEKRQATKGPKISMKCEEKLYENEMIFNAL